MLNCTIQSKPVSRIAWLFEGAEILQSNINITSNTFQDRVASSLKKKAAISDNGEYKCVAKNDLFTGDTVQSTTNVQVFGK